MIYIVPKSVQTWTACYSSSICVPLSALTIWNGIMDQPTLTGNHGKMYPNLWKIQG